MNIRGKFYFKFMWNVITTLWHSWDLTIKLNLESETVTSWSELTKEKTEIDSEDKQQEKYKDLSLGFLFDSGMREDMCFWQYLQSKKINQLILRRLWASRLSAQALPPESYWQMKECPIRDIKYLNLWQYFVCQLLEMIHKQFLQSIVCDLWTTSY